MVQHVKDQTVTAVAQVIAMARVLSLAWEFTNAKGAAKKKEKKKKERQSKLIT